MHRLFGSIVPPVDHYPAYGTLECSEIIWKWTRFAIHDIQHTTHDALSNIELWHLRRIASDVMQEMLLSASAQMPVIEEIRERFWLLCYGVSRENLMSLEIDCERTNEYLNRLRWKAHNLHA